MVKIPVFRSQNQPSRPTGPTRATLSDPRAAKGDIASVRRPGEDLAAIGRATAGVAQYLQRVSDIQKVTSRETELSRNVRDIQNRAELETDLDKGQDYLNEINALREGVSEGIADPATRLQFQSRINQSADIANLNIQNTFRAKLVDQSKADLVEFVDESREAYFDAGNPNQRAAIKKAKNDRIDLMANTGVISREAAAGLKISTDAEWAELEFKRDLQTDPDLAEHKLKNGFYNLSVEDITAAKKAINTAKEKKQKERDQALLEGQTEVEGASIAKLLSDQLTVEEMEDLEVKGGLSAQMAKVMLAVKISPLTVNATTDDKKFESLFNNLFSFGSTDLEELRKFRVDVLSQHAAGKLNKEDANFLIQRTIDPLFTPPEGRSKWKAAWETIKSWASSVGEVAVKPADMIIDLMRRNDNGELKDNDVVKTVKEIIEEKKNEITPTKNQVEVGQEVIAPNGQVGKVTGFDIDGEPIIEVIE